MLRKTLDLVTDGDDERTEHRFTVIPTLSALAWHAPAPSVHCVLSVSCAFCGQIHLTRVFSHAPCTCDHTHIVAQGVPVRISLHPHAIHDVKCLSVRLLSLRVCLFSVAGVCNPTSSWAQCRSHRAGLSSFLNTFDLSTPGRPDLTGSPCIAILWPRRMSAHGHLAAPSSPQRRTSRPPRSLCLPSGNLSTRLQRLQTCIFVLSPESCCPGRLVPPNLFHLTHYFSKSLSKFKFFVSLLWIICHILFMMSCRRRISSSKASCIR